MHMYAVHVTRTESVCGMGMRGDGVQKRGTDAGQREKEAEKRKRQAMPRTDGNQRGKSTRGAQQTAEPEQWRH